MPHRRHPIWQQVQESAGRNPHLQPWPAGLQAKSCVCIGSANNFEHASERFAQELQLAAVREHHRGGTPGCLVLALEIQLSHTPLYRNQFLQCRQKTPAEVGAETPVKARQSEAGGRSPPCHSPALGCGDTSRVLPGATPDLRLSQGCCAGGMAQASSSPLPLSLVQYCNAPFLNILLILDVNMGSRNFLPTWHLFYLVFREAD